jgi:hypothetical protein
VNLGLQICKQLQVPSPEWRRNEDMAYFETKIRELENGYWPTAQFDDEPVGLMKVDNSVEVEEIDCARLAYEAQVSYLHMALELLPSEKPELERLPLLHCFRRLRNVALHRKTLDVRHAEFSANLLDDNHPEWSATIRFKDAWFLLVRPEDLSSTKGGEKVDPGLFRAFQELCDKYPAWFLLHAAVEQLVDYFDAE